MKRFFYVAAVFVAFIAVALAKSFDSPRLMVVTSAVADIRSKPSPRSDRYEYDELQETQVLKGEPVLVFERQGNWARVECPDQMEYTHEGRWQGYPGWIEWKQLGSKKNDIQTFPKLNLPQAELRQRILAEAMKHIGSAYLWGGRSLHNPNEKKALTGVDCSGLINWAFRQVGWLIPRDAHEQFMRARPVDPTKLQPGDLIFLAKPEKPEKIVHVAFFVDANTVLEAPQTGQHVRKISFQERFGKSLRDVKSGDSVSERVIYFGTLFEGE